MKATALSLLALGGACGSSVPSARRAVRTREAHSQQLAETHVFSPFRESLYSTLPAAHLGRLRGGAGPAAAPVSAGIETPLRAAPARKKAKATPAAQDGDGADAESASPAPGTTKPPHALTIEAGTTDQESSAALMLSLIHI